MICNQACFELVHLDTKIFVSASVGNNEYYDEEHADEKIALIFVCETDLLLHGVIQGLSFNFFLDFLLRGKYELWHNCKISFSWLYLCADISITINRTIVHRFNCLNKVIEVMLAVKCNHWSFYITTLIVSYDDTEIWQKIIYYEVRREVIWQNTFN